MEAFVLKSITTVTKDGEWGKGEPFDSSVQMTVIRGTDFEGARVGLLDGVPSRYIPEHIAIRKRLQAFDILIETAGGSKNRPTGRTLLVTPSLISKSVLPVTCASFARFIRIDQKKADPAFVFWLLQYLYNAGLILQYHTQHTGVARFQFTTFAEREPLPLPPINVQKDIASILSAYDDLIENNTRRIKILEEMAQMIYREWFVNFRFPGHENVKLVESELGPIPEGWTPTRLGDLCSDKRRGVHPNDLDPNTPYIGLEHLPRKSIALGEWGRAGDVGSTKLRFKRGEILFGKIRPYFHKVGVAPVDGVASSDAIVIVPSEAVYFGAVVCCVSSEDFVLHATQTSQGTKMPRANWDVLTKYPLPIPDAPLLEQFNGAIRPIVDLLQNLVFRNRNLRTTRDLLLPKLISGEIPVDATDEQADELMEQTA